MRFSRPTGSISSALAVFSLALLMTTPALAAGPLPGLVTASRCPTGMVCNANLGLALTLPTGWQVAPTATSPPGHWVLEGAASADQPNGPLRLDISLLGTTPDPNVTRAELTGMDVAERGITIDDYEQPTLSIAGQDVILSMALAHGIPNVTGEAHVFALAHAGAVYEVIAPGNQRNSLAVDQQQALNSLQFVEPAPAPHCQFVLGFATMEQMLRRPVGFCLENEQHNPVNGDGLQHTTGGLLVWRKSDNWTAFTDGYRTWVNGPRGLEGRLNTQRFPWETNPAGLSVVPDNPYGPRTTPPPAGPTLRFERPTGLDGPGPLLFHATGSGFAPGEALTLQGTYTPTFGFPTGNPMAPFTMRTCWPQPLGPVRVTVDGVGNFTATLQVVQNFHLAGDVRLTVKGAVDGTLNTGSGGGTLPRLDAIPAGCQR